MPEQADTNKGSETSINEPLASLVKAYIDQQIQGSKESDERSRKKKWKNSWRSASPITKGTFVIATAVAVATIAYSIIAGFQLGEVRRTNDLTQKSLEGSDKALYQTLAKLQLQVDAANAANAQTHSLIAATQGAHFQIVSDISQKNGTYAYISVRAMNGGATSALHFSGESTLTRTSASGRIIQFTKKRFADSLIPTGSVGIISFTATNPPSNYMDFRNETLKIVTTINFDNGFGDRVTDSACREMVEVPNQSPGFVECGNAHDWEKLAEH